MIFGTPITWFISEIVALALFFICIVHASKQENARFKILELFGFCIASALFENAGVAGNIYNYDLHRVMMIGKVPLEIIFIEAAILYAALELVEYLKVPTWSKPLVVGLFASVQDMTLDPSAVFDLNAFDGAMSGQWNWTSYYDGNFFGIPFFNFSGWLYLMTYFTMCIMIGRWLYKKTNNKIIGYAYPFVSGVLTAMLCGSFITRFLLWMYPIFEMNQRIPELVMLIINFAIPIVILFICRNRMEAIDFKKSRIAFGIPIALHIIDIVMGYSLDITNAYVPSVLISAVHFAYFFYLFRKSRKLSAGNHLSPIRQS